MAIAILAVFAGRLAIGASVQYGIDSSQSYLRVIEGVPNSDFGTGFEVTVGSRLATTFAIVEGTAGSLQTPLTGSLVAQRFGNDLVFSGGSSIDSMANPVAPFSPTGAATGSLSVEGNFGGHGATIVPENIFIDFAVRDAIADIVTGSATIGSPGSGMFYDFVAGVIDYEVDPDLASLFDTPPLTWEPLPGLIFPVANQSTQPITEAPNGTLSIPFELDFVFESFSPGDSRLLLEGLIVATPSVATLPGDFNADNTVDSADYAAWRNGLSTQQFMLADFAAWRQNFGATQAGSATVTATPEPGSAVIVAGLVISLTTARCRRLTQPANHRSGKA